MNDGDEKNLQLQMQLLDLAEMFLVEARKALLQEENEGQLLSSLALRKVT
jgi:hypothetical protein